MEPSVTLMHCKCAFLASSATRHDLRVLCDGAAHVHGTQMVGVDVMFPVLNTWNWLSALTNTCMVPTGMTLEFHGKCTTHLLVVFQALEGILEETTTTSSLSGEK